MMMMIRRGWGWGWGGGRGCDQLGVELRKRKFKKGDWQKQMKKLSSTCLNHKIRTRYELRAKLSVSSKKRHPSSKQHMMLNQYQGVR